MNVKEFCTLFLRHLGPFLEPIGSTDQCVQLRSTAKPKAKQMRTIIPCKRLPGCEGSCCLAFAPHSAVARRIDYETLALPNRVIRSSMGAILVQRST